jgi:hypothetical protein
VLRFSQRASARHVDQRADRSRSEVKDEQVAGKPREEGADRGGINLAKILEAVGQENVERDFNQRGFRQRLLWDLHKAIPYYNTRLDFRNKRYLEQLDGKLAKIAYHTHQLTQLLNENVVLAELQPWNPDLQRSLKLLNARAGERRKGVRERIKIASAKWRKTSSRLALSTELVAYLAVVFEENFRTSHGYAHATRESARANRCGRFIKAVFSEFGLGDRGIGTIRNDLIKASSRIQRLRERRTKT